MNHTGPTGTLEVPVGPVFLVRPPWYNLHHGERLRSFDTIEQLNQVATFLAYSDESAVGHVDGEFFFGGYVAREDEWPWMTRAWQERVLDGPPPIPFLHMREIRDPRWRSEQDISFNDAEERISEATRIMDSFGNIAGIISTVRKSDMRDVFASRYRKHKNIPVGINEPDYPCFLAYAAFMIGQVYRKWPEVHKVNFIIDQKKTISHHIATFKDELTEYLEPEFRYLVGQVIPGTKEQFLPLQAADVLLWHVQRYYAAGQCQPRMDASDAMRLARLIQNGTLDGTVHHWGRSELELMADKWERVGLIPPG